MPPSKDLSGGPPPIPAELVEYLEAVYPNAFPSQILTTDPHAVSADLHRHAGKLEVVQFLRAHLQRQQAKPPKGAAQASAT